MADILERKIPYLFPGDLELRLDAQNFVTAISGYPVGGGGGTVVESDLMWKPVINSSGTLGWTRDTSATTPATADLVPHIYNNYWYVGTSNTDVEARGPQGDEGDPGYAPIITTKTVTAQGHDNSGTEITITYGEDGAQTAVYTAWNGNDGADATVTLTGGEGIEVSQAGTNYTISVSADYALKSDIPTTVAELTDSTDYAKKTDLEGFVTSSDITTQDTDYVMTTTGWKVLSLPGGGMTQVIHDTTLTGQGNDNNSKLGVAWSVLSGNTIDSAKSADVAMYYYDTVDNMPIGISTAINGIYSILDDCLATSDINPANGISGGYNSQTEKVDIGLTQTAYSAITSVSSKLDTTAAAQTYQTVAGMSDYLTTTVASQTYLDKTTYATDSATFVTSSSNTITGTKQYALTTTGWASVESAYLPLSGGTVSGKTTISGSSFDALEILRGGQASTGTVGINGAGGMSFKVTDSNSNNTQINIAPNATMDKRIFIGDSPYSPVAYLIPAVTATTTAGLTNDGILHIILES